MKKCWEAPRNLAGDDTVWASVPASFFLGGQGEVCEIGPDKSALGVVIGTVQHAL